MLHRLAMYYGIDKRNYSKRGDKMTTVIVFMKEGKVQSTITDSIGTSIYIVDWDNPNPKEKPFLVSNIMGADARVTEDLQYNPAKVREVIKSIRSLPF